MEPPSKSLLDVSSPSPSETMDRLPSEAVSPLENLVQDVHHPYLMDDQMKEDKNNEEIIRGLMELPANQMCINCNSEGPKYVCTTFWTFVCKMCSEIHREFEHHVKSVSAKFTSEEVNALQGEGNEHAMEVFFRDWGSQRLPDSSLPDNSNVDRLRDFIQHCYVYRRYTGEMVHMECVENTESDYIPLNDHINPYPNPIDVNPRPHPLTVKEIQEKRRKAKAHEEEIQEKRRRKDQVKVKESQEKGRKAEAQEKKEIQEKRRKDKPKARDEEEGKSKKKDKAKAEEEGESKKRKIEEVAIGLREIPENVSIIKDLPALSLPPNEFVMKLRDLSRHAVGLSQTTKPLKPIVILGDSGHLELPYPWKDLSIEQLARKGLGTVSGEVRCLSCESISEASLDWREAWVKSASFMHANFITFGKDMYLSWIPPSDDFDIRCEACTGMKMVSHVDLSGGEMNWLFLFLTNTVSNVSAPILEKYIRSRGILLSERPSKKELVWFLHLYMLGLLDPGVWAGFSLFAKTPRDDEISSK